MPAPLLLHFLEGTAVTPVARVVGVADSLYDAPSGISDGSNKDDDDGDVAENDWLPNVRFFYSFLYLS